MNKEANKIRNFQQIQDKKKYYETVQLKFQNNIIDEQTFRIIKTKCDLDLERLLKIQEKLNRSAISPD